MSADLHDRLRALEAPVPADGVLDLVRARGRRRQRVVASAVGVVLVATSGAVVAAASLGHGKRHTEPAVVGPASETRQEYAQRLVDDLVLPAGLTQGPVSNLPGPVIGNDALGFAWWTAPVGLAEVKSFLDATDQSRLVRGADVDSSFVNLGKAGAPTSHTTTFAYRADHGASLQIVATEATATTTYLSISSKVPGPPTLTSSAPLGGRLESDGASVELTHSRAAAIVDLTYGLLEDDAPACADSGMTRALSTVRLDDVGTPTVSIREDGCRDVTVTVGTSTSAKRFIATSAFDALVADALHHRGTDATARDDRAQDAVGGVRLPPGAVSVGAPSVPALSQAFSSIGPDEGFAMGAWDVPLALGEVAQTYSVPPEGLLSYYGAPGLVGTSEVRFHTYIDPTFTVQVTVSAAPLTATSSEIVVRAEVTAHPMVLPREVRTGSVNGTPDPPRQPNLVAYVKLVAYVDALPLFAGSCADFKSDISVGLDDGSTAGYTVTRDATCGAVRVSRGSAVLGTYAISPDVSQVLDGLASQTGR